MYWLTFFLTSCQALPLCSRKDCPCEFSTHSTRWHSIQPTHYWLLAFYDEEIRFLCKQRIGQILEQSTLRVVRPLSRHKLLRKSADQALDYGHGSQKPAKCKAQEIFRSESPFDWGTWPAVGLSASKWKTRVPWLIWIQSRSFDRFSGQTAVVPSLELCGMQWEQCSWQWDSSKSLSSLKRCLRKKVTREVPCTYQVLFRTLASESIAEERCKRNRWH